MINIYSLPDPIINVDYENVYAPSDDSFLIIDYFRHCYTRDFFDGLDMKKIKNVLDMGTGTGILAIFLQMLKVQHPLFNPMIYASDILEDALECAKNNEKYNNFNENIAFIRSNLFESFPKSLKRSFNIIVFNPPYLPSSELGEPDERKTTIDHSWDGGIRGYEVFSRFLEEVKDFMDPNNCATYYICSSRVNLENLNNIVDKNGFSSQVLNKKHFFFEDIILNKLTLV